MARIPRKLTVLPNFVVHKTWRGHNREDNIKTTEEKLKYLEFFNKDLESKKYKTGGTPQALTLMSNHVHELFEILAQTLFSDFMRRHHGNYGQWFNRLKNRSGKVAEGRPHTTLIEDDHHAMRAVFYIHANPIRAGIVKDARNYRWSTHRWYAFGIWESWMRNIELPSWYLKLGKNASIRQREYQRLFEDFLKTDGPQKQLFLNQIFYGQSSWIAEKILDVSQWRKENRTPD